MKLHKSVQEYLDHSVRLTSSKDGILISLKPESSQKDHETLVNIEPGISQELSFILVTVEV